MIQPLLLASSSAILLIIAFPNFNQPWCAWVALVPWLALVRACSSRTAWWWSYGIGAVFFLASMWWLIHVTVVGWLLLCAYLAVYFGAFGWLVHVVALGSRLKALGNCLQPPASSLERLLVIPAAWVALEYLRSHLLSGFGWNLLAYSQTPWVVLIQCADLTGAWGLSFLIVLVNVALSDVVRPVSPRASTVPTLRAEMNRAMTRQPREPFASVPLGSSSWNGTSRAAALGVAATCVLAAVGYGVWCLSQAPGSQTVRVAVVQGNIPQAHKWDEAFQGRILAQYEALTETVAAAHPDLIVWPETAVPGFLGLEETLTQRILGLAQRLQRPLLVGTPTRRLTAGRFAALNSAMLIDRTGVVAGRYDKLHLVPFGEFIPFERWAPWLRAVLPPIGEFVPGHEFTVFTTPVQSSELRVPSSNSQLSTRHPQLRFSVLICFEDIFPELARRFVRDGARMLLVMTNDAWFGPTAAAYQHTQASTFRAVELRVPVARAANTGWSGCIDSVGRWVGRVRDQRGAELFVSGVHTCDIPLGPAHSLYRRWGDWFALLCLFGTAGWIIAAGLSRSVHRVTS